MSKLTVAQQGADAPNPATGKQSWCHPRAGTPTPLSYGGNYNGANQVGAWGWCGGAPFTSGNQCSDTL